MRDDLVDAAMAGNRRALARLLSRVEAGGAAAEAVVQALYSRSGAAHVVGVTGAPGTGKSTLVGQMARLLRRGDQRVAIIAVDPSSPFTGGALLGDRIRMNDLADDPDIFMRSMASRGAGGGLSEQTAATCVVLAAAGFSTVIVETVGVGQDELAIAGEAQTTIVVTAPGLGDGVQALKSGILEVADALVVNKADREGADRLVAELRFGRGRTQSAVLSPQPWAVPIVKTVATTGEGIEELAAAVTRHREWLRESVAGKERARALAGRHILRSAAAAALRRAEQHARESREWDDLVAGVVAHRCSPAEAARRLLESAAQRGQRGVAGERA